MTQRNSICAAIVLLLLTSVFAHGGEVVRGSKTRPPMKASEADRTKEDVELFNGLLNDANERLQWLRYDSEEDCPECTVQLAGTDDSTLETPAADQVCRETWERFYSKDIIDLNITFGYADSSTVDRATDTLERQAMVDQVSKPCDEADRVRACGFSRSVTDDDVFEKAVKGPTGTLHLVRLRLTASSVSTMDRLNRQLSDQNRQSELAENSFHSALCDAQMVMYVGHARNGGGPDFRPALRKTNGLINYKVYEKTTPGVDRVESTLRGCKAAPLMGFLACESSRWDRRLSAAAPKAGLVLSETELMPAEIALQQSYYMLDSVLWQRCEGAFNKALNRVRSIKALDPNTKQVIDKQIIPIRIKGFFRANSARP